MKKYKVYYSNKRYKIVEKKSELVFELVYNNGIGYKEIYRKNGKV